MNLSFSTYDLNEARVSSYLREEHIETGFIDTPIFVANATLQKIEDTTASMRTTEDLFQMQFHAYTNNRATAGFVKS